MDGIRVPFRHSRSEHSCFSVGRPNPRAISRVCGLRTEALGEDYRGMQGYILLGWATVQVAPTRFGWQRFGPHFLMAKNRYPVLGLSAGAFDGC